MSPPPSPKFSTDDLPILEKASEAYTAWHKALPRLPKLSRYTLGEKIDNLFIETLELILLASHLAKLQKLPAIQGASSKLDTLKFFLQLAWKMKILNNQEYLAAAGPLAEVGKMLGGWQKQLLRP